MEAQALICDEQQNFHLEKVDVGEATDTQISIETHYSGVSIGTEFALIRNKISWGPYPLCTGYMGTGVVRSVGSNVVGYSIGDKVYFRQNQAEMRRSNGERVSQVCGTHCSIVHLEPDGTHGAAKIPEGAPFDLAAHFVMPAVGHYGVDMANPQYSDIVVVHGVGLIGLGVVTSCAQRGCKVIAIDIHDEHLERAKKLGADYCINSRAVNMLEVVKTICESLKNNNDGADVVFECSGIPACINPSIELCRTHGSFVWQGNYGEAPISFNFLPAHIRQLRMFFPCDDGYETFRNSVLKNMASGALKWEHCITHRVNSTEACDLYTTIQNNPKHGVLGALIQWQ